MSKAEKMRHQLAAMQKDREDYERQKKELEDEMHRGRQNMGKIKKGLREGGIVNDQFLASESVVEPETPNQSRKPSRVAPPKISNKSTTEGATPSAAKESDKFPLPSPFSPDRGQSVISSIIPSGPRISEWCFTGDINSAPPIVKSRDMYENVRLLGRGSFGEVNLVKNVEDNKLFAIKTIFCAKDADMGPVMHEVKFLRLSRHPCIIDIHDAFLMTNPRVMHIVMHYCESGSLASYISNTKKNRSSISESQIIKWIIQLALALQFMHDVNHTIHRDIKPMNVMLTEGGEIIKLADFGLALNMDECSVSESFAEAGTPYYTAPEMIRGENYSYPADCWSFGIIMHQLLTLERPFEGSSTAGLVKSILTEEPPVLPIHYSEDLRAISAGLLIKDPIDRVSMAQLLSDPYIHSKASAFPNSYRPKTLEERIRRSHVKLLEHQMDALPRSSKTIAQSVKSINANKMSTPPPPLEANNSAPVLSMENVQAMATVEVSKIDESTQKSTEKVAAAILDKIGEGGGGLDKDNTNNSNSKKKQKHQYLMQSFASVSDDEESAKHTPVSGKSGHFTFSSKEEPVSGKEMLSILNPNDTQQGNNRKLTAEEAEELARVAADVELSRNSNGNAMNLEDLHGPISFHTDHVIKMRSTSYHGHVNSDEERDAMITPFMSGKFGPGHEHNNGASLTENNSTVGDDDDIGFNSPVRIDSITQNSDIFGTSAGTSEFDDGGAVPSSSSVKSIKRIQSSMKAETPLSNGTSESPNNDSSPMPGQTEKSVTFSDSNRSLISEESTSAHTIHNSSSLKLTHALSMDAIKEDPSEIAAGAAGPGESVATSSSVKTSTSLSTGMDAMVDSPASSKASPQSKAGGGNGGPGLMLDVNEETLVVESATTPMQSEKLSQSRKGKELARAIEADSYYESKLNN